MRWTKLMKAYQPRCAWLILLATTLVAGCALSPVPEHEVRPASAIEKHVKVDETAMLPLLGYLQLLARMTPKELQREKTVLTTIPGTPAMHIRTAMLLGQGRLPMDLARAIALLEGVLISGEPPAASLHPLARALVNQYNARLRLQLQSEKLFAQNEKLGQQLHESQRRGLELQEKLDALADIERTLPVRPKAGESLPGATK